MDPLLLLFASVITGAVTATITEKANQAAATEELDRQKKYLSEQELEEEATLLTNFLNDQEEANRQADETDADATKTEALSSNDFNNSLEDIFNSQQTEGAQFNAAEMQAGQSTGTELAQIANSGIRAGGSLSQAVELEAAVNSSQLQLQEDTQRRSDTTAINSLSNNLAKQEYSIFQNRRSADDTRDSYLEGGYNYKKYQTNLASIQNSYTLKIKSLQDEYDDYMSNKSKASRYFTNFFGNGSSALKTFSSLSDINFLGE